MADRELRGRVTVQDRGASATIRKVTADTQRLGTSATKTTASVRGLGGGFGILKTAIAGLGFATFLRELKEAVGTIAEFGAQMSKVAAVSGATGETLTSLTDTAKELGATTVFSATEAAEGMEFLARAGFSANEVIEAIPATLDLAASGALELGRAADIASNVLGGFGAEVDDLERFVDVLAKTAASANTDVNQLGEAMSKVAPVAKLAGLSVEETSAAIGILGNAGIQATEAGTALRRILLNLEAPTSTVSGALESAGLSLEDVSVSANGLEKVLQTLGDANLTTAQKADIFGARAVAAGENLLSARGSVNELTVALNEAEGAAGRMAGVMQDNLSGSAKALNSAIEGAILAFGEGLGPALRDITDDLTSTTRDLEGLAAAGKVFGGTIQILVSALQSLPAGLNVIKLVLGSLVAQFVLLQAKVLDVRATLKDAFGDGEAAASLRREADLLREGVSDFLDPIAEDVEKSTRRVRDSFISGLENVEGGIRESGVKVDEELNRLTEGMRGGIGEATETAEEELKRFQNVFGDAFEGFDTEPIVEKLKQGADEVGDAAGTIGEKAGEGFDILKEVLGQTREEVQQGIQSIGEAFGSVEGQINLRFLSDEDRDRLKGEIQEIVENARFLGEQLEPEFAAVAARVGVIIPAYEIATDASWSLDASQKALAESSVEVVEGVDAAGNAFTKIQQKAVDAGTGVGQFKDKLPGSETQTAAENLGELGEAGGSVAESADAASTKLGELGESATGTATGIDGLKTAIDGLANTDPSVDATRRLRDALQETVEPADQVKLAIQDLANADPSQIPEALEKMNIALADAPAQAEKAKVAVLAALKEIQEEAARTGTALSDALSAES